MLPAPLVRVFQSLLPPSAQIVTVLEITSGKELSQRELIAMAFAGDDVEAEFDAQKAEEAQAELPKARTLLHCAMSAVSPNVCAKVRFVQLRRGASDYLFILSCTNTIMPQTSCSGMGRHAEGSFACCCRWTAPRCCQGGAAGPLQSACSATPRPPLAKLNSASGLMNCSVGSVLDSRLEFLTSA